MLDFLDTGSPSKTRIEILDFGRNGTTGEFISGSVEEPEIEALWNGLLVQFLPQRRESAGLVFSRTEFATRGIVFSAVASQSGPGFLERLWALYPR